MLPHVTSEKLSSNVLNKDWKLAGVTRTMFTLIMNGFKRYFSKAMEIITRYHKQPFSLD